MFCSEFLNADLEISIRNVGGVSSLERAAAARIISTVLIVIVIMARIGRFGLGTP